ncbi:MAG TPA: hypothetical protein PLK67_04720 [Bryobacteraceae bacterium]|nr:hypothetical protein [Bryobacteraceae bacterium]HOL70991.1 hypothetical protein [Bryobacteraceae bacterium]
MSTKRFRLHIGELPPRSTPLSTEQLRTVMGGCNGDNQSCNMFS